MNYLLAIERFNKMFIEKDKNKSIEYLEIVFNYGINLIFAIKKDIIIFDTKNIEENLKIIAMELKIHLDQIFQKLVEDIKHIHNFNKDELYELLIVYKKMRLFYIDNNSYFNEKNIKSNKIDEIGKKIIIALEKYEEV